MATVLDHIAALMGRKEAERNLASVFVEAVRRGGGYCPAENDTGLNEASRKLIRAMHAEHGEAWLFLVNKKGAVPQKWEPGGLLYTFCADYVLPTRNAEVESLINTRHSVEYTGTKSDSRRVHEIMEAVFAAGGSLLQWS